jgi:regulator of protease activity HflC (stomatin/prohibitin superfamily)
MPTAKEFIESINQRRMPILLTILLIVGGIYFAPSLQPMATVGHGEIGVRINRLTGKLTEFHKGGVLLIPGVHHLRRFNLHDQIYRPVRSSKAKGEAPFQSVEGLSIGVDLTIRYALDPSKVTTTAMNLPEDINGKVVEPLVEGIIYKILAKHTVREIFSTQRDVIQKSIETDLKPLLAADGILLKAVFMGNVDLPEEYRTGMDSLLAEELNAEKMRYTLELKEKEVKQKGLEADAEKLKREKAAEAAGNEEIIAAKAKAEAMKHIIPFKQKQIEQRKLEAEAEKASRMKTAEGEAEARRISAAGEADSRRKLAEAEAYRVEVVGKASSEQLARDSALITQNPLLIQKTLADKLSDKISVIIAPPPESGGFIASGILGTAMPQAKTPPKAGADSAGNTSEARKTE